MKPYPVIFRHRTRFELVPSWVPPVLQDWLDQGWTCDITVKRVKVPHGSKILLEIEASTSEDLAAKRKAINAMIEAKGYGPGANKK